MCIYKTEIRPGLDGIVDYTDIINDVQRTISPILTLIILSNCNLEKEEWSNLASHLDNILKEAWLASEGIYKLYRKEKGYAD